MLVLCSSSWAVPTLATFPCDHPWGKAKWLQYYIYESGSYCWERKKISNGIYKVWQMAPQSWKGGTVDFRFLFVPPPTTKYNLFSLWFSLGSVGFRFGDMGAALLVKRFESTSVKLAILKIKMLHRCKIFSAGVKKTAMTRHKGNNSRWNQKKNNCIAPGHGLQGADHQKMLCEVFFRIKDVKIWNIFLCNAKVWREVSLKRRHKLDYFFKLPSSPIKSHLNLQDLSRTIKSQQL